MFQQAGTPDQTTKTLLKQQQQRRGQEDWSELYYLFPILQSRSQAHPTTVSQCQVFPPAAETDGFHCLWP